MPGFIDVRRQVLRRVRYATNTLALYNNTVPPEGPFDAALTNGLAAIVAEEAPGQEWKDPSNGIVKSARVLMRVAWRQPGLREFIDRHTLDEGLALSQPARHGRADDEFAAITGHHIRALAALDRHPALHFLEAAQGQSIDQCFVLAYRELATGALLFDPKDRSLVPDIEECPNCWRETFLPSGWDIFGGTFSAGFCLACGYERSDSEAYDEAIQNAIRRHMEED